MNRGASFFKPQYYSIDYLGKLKTQVWAQLSKKEYEFAAVYEMQKFLTPEKFVKGADPNKRPRQLRYHLRGQVSARESTVLKISNKLPKTKCWYFSPIWPLFERSEFNEEEIDRLVSEIKDIEVLKKIIDKKSSTDKYVLKKRILFRSIKSLEKKPSCDSLSGLTLLLWNIECACFLKNEIPDHETKHYLLNAILRVLISLAVIYEKFDIFEVLFKCFEKRYSYHWKPGEIHWKIWTHMRSDVWEIDNKGYLTICNYLRDLLIIGIDDGAIKSNYDKVTFINKFHSLNAEDKKNIFIIKTNQGKKYDRRIFDLVSRTL